MIGPEAIERLGQIVEHFALLDEFVHEQPKFYFGVSINQRFKMTFDFSSLYLSHFVYKSVCYIPFWLTGLLKCPKSCRKQLLIIDIYS